MALTKDQEQQAAALKLSPDEAQMAVNLGVDLAKYAARKARPQSEEEVLAEQFRMFRELSAGGTLPADQRAELKRRLGLQGGDQ